MVEMQMLIIMFALLLMLPIIVASLYYKKQQGKVLFINQNKVRDPRYFGKSYSSMIRKNLPNIVDDEIQLSKKEKFINGDIDNLDSDVIDKMVICRENQFTGKKGVTYEKEIYSEQQAFLEEDTKVRALYSASNIVVGNGMELLRWLDSDGTIAIYDNCDLGFSVSSGKRISLGHNCKFRRIYAPEIYIGQYPGKLLDPTKGKDSRIYRLPVQTKKEKNIRYISNEMINEDGIVDCSILAPKNVSVTENIIVRGDIRSHKGVRLFDGAIVVGNIFAEEDVILGKNSCVIGNVFSQENVYLETGAVVGKIGAISSIIARGNITLEPETFVFGYVSCEREGKVLSLKEERKQEEYIFLEEKEKQKLLNFKNLADYEGVSQQGYRFHEFLEEVYIPEGARNIPRSMFFKCISLEKIDIPDSIEEIEDFAFMDCGQLKEISLKEKKGLRRIGISAFENCSSLERIEIPESVVTIDAAAFSGCTNLKEVIFAEDSQLKTVYDHAFQGCLSLEEIKFTSHVDISSHNTFINCENLGLIHIPEEQVLETGV